MIHAFAIAESIVAPTLFRPEFLHSLGHKRKSSVGLRMSAVGGGADLNFRRLKVRF
jgi:hypothetical protein